MEDIFPEDHRHSGLINVPPPLDRSTLLSHRYGLRSGVAIVLCSMCSDDMPLDKKERVQALITLTAALISRSSSLPHSHSQLVNDAEALLDDILARAETWESKSRVRPPRAGS